MMVVVVAASLVVLFAISDVFLRFSL